jgi:hypothetical protein
MMMIRRSAQVRRAMHPGRRPQPSLFRAAQNVVLHQAVVQPLASSIEERLG